MKLILTIIFVSLSLCSCSTPKKIIEVDYKPSDIPVPTKPSLPIRSLSLKSNPDEVMKAYVASVYLQKSYIDEVIKMIDSINYSSP